MLKLVKYLKTSILPILLIVLLLVVQAMCDLSLPDYTAKIVDIGIQKGGIEDAVPTYIRQSEMEKLFLFIGGEDRQRVEASYTLLDKDSLSDTVYDKLRRQIPAIETQPIYELGKVTEDEREILDGIFKMPMLIVSGFSGGGGASEEMLGMFAADMPDGLLESGQDMLALFAGMPEEGRLSMVDAIRDKMAVLPDSVLDSRAAAYLKEEYRAEGIDVDGIQNGYVLLSGAKMLGIALLSMAVTILVSFLAARVAAALGRELRGRVFRKVVGFSHTEFDHFSTASLITRSTNDIQQIQMLFVMLLRIVFYAPIMGVGGVFKVMSTNASMAWIIGVAVLAIIAIVLVLFVVAMPKFNLMQKLVDKLNLVTREILTGLPVIRAFSTEKYEEERFDKANRNLTRTNLFVNRVMSCMMPVMMLVMNGITLLIVWNGGHGIQNGTMQVGDMMAFIQYTMQIVMAFLMICMMSIMWPRAAVSARRIEEVIQTEAVIRDPEVPASFDEARKGVVEFRDVSFRYPGADENVLTGISFTAKPGETTAFIGSTGSGKSTLINLIPRFYDVSEGSILVSGADVRHVPLHDLRARIGYVPQKGMLFSGTIESNLKYGGDAVTNEDMMQAARIAQAEDFISRKPDTYGSEISQGGTNVSGGQKQRLSIARAIAIHPDVYIFDDSFSALDYKTDVALRRALRDQTRNSTVLIVAQRISTILHADQILVLDEGKIVGRGTHKELMASCEEYRQIAESQLSKEELAQ